ncbi:hypothetical protein KY495_01035 [Massilia sp. PAMC28688]|uniref:hypothetical protein n=1 Tax=Massilia sp. PAMC28688 TaxID=2861283 RepID=UPI001C6281C4|nr:hypothetical protein [Massilia sp. PAMC28688]QYF93859.1 hypothetical protein KY495_01035 [Massilia sp. PAMC28688]
MLIESVTACADFSQLVGRRVNAYFHADGYWRFFVALRMKNGRSVVFSTEDRGLAKYFEVFPLKFDLEPSEPREWVSLEPLLIKTARPLWRLEWLERTPDNGKFLGSGPHHIHHAGAGPVSQTAVHAARVLAGIALSGAAGRTLIVSASDSAPFNLDIAVEPAAVASMIRNFSSPQQ